MYICTPIFRGWTAFTVLGTYLRWIAVGLVHLPDFPPYLQHTVRTKTYISILDLFSHYLSTIVM